MDKEILSQNYTSLLDLGCGGGKNIFTLKHHFQVTGLDISPDMLALCRELNPDVSTICADMRDFTVDEAFDVIYIDDAISYINTKDDVRRVLKNCCKHLAEDGLMILTPDVFKEDFIQHETDVFQSIKHKLHPEVEVTYITNNYDPDPEDDSYECTFVYLIRQKGRLTLDQELHVLGVFSLDTWLGWFAELGLECRQETHIEDGHSYKVFILSKM